MPLDLALTGAGSEQIYKSRPSLQRLPKKSLHASWRSGSQRAAGASSPTRQRGRFSTMSKLEINHAAGEEQVGHAGARVLQQQQQRSFLLSAKGFTVGFL